MYQLLVSNVKNEQMAEALHTGRRLNASWKLLLVVSKRIRVSWNTETSGMPRHDILFQVATAWFKDLTCIFTTPVFGQDFEGGGGLNRTSDCCILPWLELGQ